MNMPVWQAQAKRAAWGFQQTQIWQKSDRQDSGAHGTGGELSFSPPPPHPWLSPRALCSSAAGISLGEKVLRFKLDYTANLFF